MVITSLLTICLIPAWVLPNSKAGLSAGSFFLQLIFRVLGLSLCVTLSQEGGLGNPDTLLLSPGVVPIYLADIDPSAFVALFIGMTYRLDNAISSPSTQIVGVDTTNRQLLDLHRLTSPIPTISATSLRSAITSRTT